MICPWQMVSENQGLRNMSTRIICFSSLQTSQNIHSLLEFFLISTIFLIERNFLISQTNHKFKLVNPLPQDALPSVTCLRGFAQHILMKNFKSQVLQSPRFGQRLRLQGGEWFYQSELSCSKQIKQANATHQSHRAGWQVDSRKTRRMTHEPRCSFCHHQEDRKSGSH